MEITTWVVIGCLPSRLERQGAAAADVRAPAPVPATAALLPQLAPALSPSARLPLAGGCRRALLQADTVVRSFGCGRNSAICLAAQAFSHVIRMIVRCRSHVCSLGGIRGG